MPAFFMLEFEIGFLGLFLTSFLAATVLPIASEAFLIGMLLWLIGIQIVFFIFLM